MHKTAVPNGLFLGAAMIICSYVVYIVNAAEFYSARPTLLLAILFLLFLKTGKEVRRSGEGYLTWGQGFKNMFVTGAIAILLCSVFEYLMLNFLATDLMEIKRELDHQALEKVREILGEKYESVVEAQEEKLENENYGIGFHFQQFLQRLVAPVAFVSSFISLFIMRKPPEGKAPTDQDDPKRYVINK